MEKLLFIGGPEIILILLIFLIPLFLLIIPWWKVYEKSNKPRYSNVISLLLIFLLISCNNFEKYYPSGTENDIYIDNSNINNFELYMIYNITDTVFDEKKIYIVDTLKFRITEDGVESLNNKYLIENNYNIFTKYTDNNTIEVYSGKDIEVIIKKDREII